MPETRLPVHFFDGQKNIDLSTISLERWEELFGTDSVTSTGRLHGPVQGWSTQGWVNRCVNIRANTVASMPWTISRGETEIATSDDPDYPYPWLDRFSDFLYLTESALSIVGDSYIFKEQTRSRRILKLQWLAPHTMSPIWGYNEIAYFNRRVEGRNTERLEVEDVIYTRLLNPISETKSAPSPVEVALSDAGVLVNLNNFATQFFARGAIRAMLLTVEGDVRKEEMEKLERWWKRMFKGIRNAWETAALRAKVNPVMIGDGIGDLNNQDLTTEKREAISSALGVPHSLVMSNAANFATAQADRLNFYDTTIVPECRLIESALNRQLFVPMGLTFRFRPQSLPVYQEDEGQMSVTIKNLTQAGIRPSHAMLILGRSLPEGLTEAQIDEIYIANMTRAGGRNNGLQTVSEPQNEGDVEEVRSAFRRWLKNNPNRVERLEDFSAPELTMEEREAIAGEVLCAG